MDKNIEVVTKKYDQEGHVWRATIRVRIDGIGSAVLFSGYIGIDATLRIEEVHRCELSDLALASTYLFVHQQQALENIRKSAAC